MTTSQRIAALLALALAAAPVAAPPAAADSSSLEAIPPGEMNCGDQKHMRAPDIGMEEFGAITDRFWAQFPTLAAAADPAIAGTYKDYALTTCNLKGRPDNILIVDGVRLVDEAAACDDKRNFRLAYDRQTKTFGALKFGLGNTCYRP